MGLFLLLFVIGCGGSSSGSSGKMVPLVPTELEDVIREQEFQCRSLRGGGCPAGIARLFILNPDSPETSSLCTGFLIDDQRLLTNHHCVPGPGECANTYISVLTSIGPVAARCGRFLSGELSPGVDVALLELDTVIPGSDFLLSGTSPDFGDTRVWVMDHLDLRKAFVTEFECEFTRRGNSMFLEKCPAIAGNSGSPVIQSGRVKGIIWGSNVPETIGADFPLGRRRELRAISLATELPPLLPGLTGEDFVRTNSGRD